ncbi:MAG: hypothetical protein AUH96_12625 [Nitrospirae bacterium 13_2_20CM_2_61_4]|nr:MAG: hypothetical protein AUH96_12625 [Nitrospirae bacterium 13_2_20CM_2_61_4]
MYQLGHTDEIQRGLLRLERCNHSHHRPGRPKTQVPLLCFDIHPGLPKRRQIHAAANDRTAVSRKESKVDALPTTRLRDSKKSGRNASNDPLYRQQCESDQWVLVGCQPESMDGVNDDRNPGKPSSETSKDASLRAVGMDDRGLQGPEEHSQGHKRAQIAPRTKWADHRQDLVEVHPGKCLGFLIQHAGLSGDEHRAEPGRIQMRQREQGVLLRAAQFELGDDVTDCLHSTVHLKLYPLPYDGWALASDNLVP